MARKTNYTKNGQEYFRITATVGRDSYGKLIRKEFYGKSKSEAEAKRDEYLNNIKNGLSLDYKNAVLGDLMHTWLFEVVRVSNGVKASSFERYESIYRNYVKDSEIYGLKLDGLKPIQIQRYYNKLYDDGKKSTLITNINKLLRTFFNYAVNEGYLLTNPCSGKRIVIPGKKSVNQTEVEVFTTGEISVFKAALNKHRLKALFLLALGTGLRQGELLGLKWSDIDFKDEELKVERSIRIVEIINRDGSRNRETVIQDPKSKDSIRTVPIPSNLIPVLNAHKLKQAEEKLKAGDSYITSDFVFTTELGKTIDARNLLRSYTRLLKKADIPYRKFHALRHTYATKLFEADIPLKTVQKLLGHSDISITANVYTHVIPKEKNKAAERINDLFA